MTIPDLEQLRQQVLGGNPATLPANTLPPITDLPPAAPTAPPLPFHERAERAIDSWIDGPGSPLLKILFFAGVALGACIGAYRGAVLDGFSGFFGGIFIGAAIAAFYMVVNGAILLWLMKKAIKHWRASLTILAGVIFLVILRSK